jgi:hypothetical protein
LEDSDACDQSVHHLIEYDHVLANETAKQGVVLRRGSNNSQLIHPKLQNMQQKAPNTTNQASRPPSGLSLGSNTGGEAAAATTSSSRCPSSWNDECEDCDPRLYCFVSIVVVLSAILGFWNTGQRETSKV